MIAALSMAFATGLLLSAPVLSSRLIEVLIGQRPDAQFPKLLASITFIYVMEPVMTFFYVKNVCAVGEEVVARLREDLFRALLVQRIEFFDRNQTAKLAATLSVELGTVRTLVAANVSRDRGFRAIGECLGTLAVLWRIAPKLAPVLGFAVVSLAAVTAVFNRKNGRLFAADAAAQGAVSAAASATLGAVRTVRSFGGEALAFVRFGEDVAKAKASGANVSNARAGLEVANRGCVYASLITLYAFGGWLVKTGAVPVGSLIAAVGYTFGLIFATQGVVNTLADANAAIAALKRATSLVTETHPDPSLVTRIERVDVTMDETDDDREEEEDGSAAAGGAGWARSRADRARNAARSGDVTLEDVCFAYPGRTDSNVLRGVNLTLRRGKTTALVGSSGAGKSTVTQLLCRFYEPDAGSVAVGGVNLADGFDSVDWLDAVALVGQEPKLFAGTVRENIAYGRAGAVGRSLGDAHEGAHGGAHEFAHGVPTEDEIVAAAKAANAHDFIVELPEGYDTPVGEGGGALSGGQRQRVAIARAILKDAPILILDEATSALDARSEAAVQSALERLMRGRTTLVIAHRLATVQAADAIAVMEKGKVVEFGSHAELSAREGGVYSALVNSQRLSFADA
jgi:ATP-binding cassette subfamily B (MDR/TAP) protein 10